MIALVLLLLAPAAAADPAEEATRLVVLANAGDPASVALADEYARFRGVPRENIVALPMSRDETVDWPTFVQEIYNPLQDWLLAHGWLEAILMDLHDDAGRRKVAVSGHRISYLLVCRGVPLRLRASPGLPPDLPASAPAPMRTAQASVDSELAVLPQPGSRREGFLPNPLFDRPDAGRLERDSVLRVVRLDGPSDTAVRELLARVREAEAFGLSGRAYVDLGGPHALGDRWLEAVAQLLEQAEFETTVDRERPAFGAEAPADGAALYFGWYEPDISGPFAERGFRFAPGAIALHLHSSSATTLRNDARGWCGPLIARGAAATFGNVFEPYLEYTQRPDLLLRALLAGVTLGEAAYQSLPVLSWQTVVIGDPLYRPFRVTADEQYRRWRDLPPERGADVLRREAHRRERRGDPAGALEVLREGWIAAPSLPLAVALAQRLAAGGLTDEAVQILRVQLERTVEPAERPRLAEAARLLEQEQALGDAVLAWEKLIESDASEKARRAWLPEAAAAALRAGDTRRATRWSEARAGDAAPAP